MPNTRINGTRISLQAYILNILQKFKNPSVEGEEGINRHSVDEFNSLIEAELDELFKSMNVAIEQLAQLYKVVDYQNMPILLIGGGSRLKGLVPYLVAKNVYNNIQTVLPRSLGARDPSLFALIGAIYVENKYPNTSDTEIKNNVNVSRED